jgi:hypothetical protein
MYTINTIPLNSYQTYVLQNLKIFVIGATQELVFQQLFTLANLLPFHSHFAHVKNLQRGENINKWIVWFYGFKMNLTCKFIFNI